MSSLVMTKECKHGDTACGSGYWDCGKCKDEIHRAAYKRLTPAQKDYDNFVDPRGAYHTDYDSEPRGCSCHINPPCNYCTSKSDDDT